MIQPRKNLYLDNYFESEHMQTHWKWWNYRLNWWCGTNSFIWNISLIISCPIFNDFLFEYAFPVSGKRFDLFFINNNNNSRCFHQHNICKSVLCATIFHYNSFAWWEGFIPASVISLHILIEFLILDVDYIVC